MELTSGCGEYLGCARCGLRVKMFQNACELGIRVGVVQLLWIQYQPWVAGQLDCIVGLGQEVTHT